MRVAAVRYINALPLIYGLENQPEVELLFETPSACYQMLIQGEADVGLIPVIGTQFDSSLRAIKGLGIASQGRSESVYLFAKKPLDRVETIATDPASLTSVVLLKIVMKQKYGNSPQFRPFASRSIHDVLRDQDAALVIGDEAILADKSDYDHYDLAAEWYSLTQLPFVFAFWAANKSLSESELQILQEPYHLASQNWGDLYRKAQQTLPVGMDFLKRYYNVNLRFRFISSDYEGMFKFFSLAAEDHLIDQVREDIWL
jgi:chorismate dehydratase